MKNSGESDSLKSLMGKKIKLKEKGADMFCRWITKISKKINKETSNLQKAAVYK